MPNDAADEGSTTRRSTTRRTWTLGAIVATVIAIDQATKAWAVAALPQSPVSIIGDDVEFRLIRNRGGAFNLYDAFTPLFGALALVIAVFLVRAVRRAENRVTVVGLSLVLGGAIGNLADRVFRAPGFMRGAVVDFVHVGWWPSFNVADSALTIGALLVVGWSLLRPHPKHETTA